MAQQRRGWSRSLIAIVATLVSTVSLAAGVVVGATPAGATNCPDQHPDQPSTEVNCLFFTAAPANAVVSTNITSQGFNPSGTAVTVLATDDENIAVSGASVSLTLVQSSSTSATLGGTVSGTTSSSGVVTFSSLNIDQVGYYQLEASGSGFTSVTSPVFYVAGQVTPCTGKSCSGTETTGTGQASATVVNAGGDFLTLGVGGFTYGCTKPDGTPYQSVSGVIATDVWNSSGNGIDASVSALTTIDINKATVLLSPNNGAAEYQVCYASTAQFPGSTPDTLNIGTSSIQFFVGLLPDCHAKSGPVPCVVSRSKTGSGDVIIKFLGTGDFLGQG